MCIEKYPSAKKSLNVLHIEDNARDAELCVDELERAGFQVSADVVRSPEELSERLHARTYDIALVDYSLPNWNGLAAIDILHQLEKDLPFIVVSASAEEQFRAECTHRGASDFVPKDGLTRLATAVHRALEERKPLYQRTDTKEARRPRGER